MYCTGHEQGVINPPRTRITCGSWLWIIAKKPYRRQHHCNTWGCLDGICQGRLIDNLQKEIKAAAGATVAITDTLRARSAKDDKHMSNFLTRHVTGKFWKVLSDDRCLLISTVDFPGSVRRPTWKVINEFIPAILTEPWTPSADKKIRRVTRRRGQRQAKPKNKETAYAMVAAGEGREEAMKEFTAFRTDYQRAEWLLQPRQEKMTLYNRGKSIIADYLNTRAAATR